MDGQAAVNRQKYAMTEEQPEFNLKSSSMSEKLYFIFYLPLLSIFYFYFY